jgi:5-oxoprolinase (ATP-hydrolysing)
VAAQGEIFDSLTGEALCVRRPLDEAEVCAALQPALDAGIRSIAVVLKHSALFPDHEDLVGCIAREMGFTHVSLSSAVMKMVKMVPRGFTAAADAYLTPTISRYLDTFQSGFDEGLKSVELSFMQSDGGLSPADAFSGHKAVLSGPAAGYVGYAETTEWDGMPTDKKLQACVDSSGAWVLAHDGQHPQARAMLHKRSGVCLHAADLQSQTIGRDTRITFDVQVIGFDMGGTSTDVSRYDGTFEHVLESTTAGVTIQAPQLDINTVAAGGGSRLFFNNGTFVVGPESAGAEPGPARPYAALCFRFGCCPVAQNLR